MEISCRDLITVLHGMGFGALFMLAFSGAIGVIYATSVGGARWSPPPPGQTPVFRFYLISMAALAWLAVLSGSYLVYPWYRAVPPPGTTDLAAYPAAAAAIQPAHRRLARLGMEWKEHIAWFTPIAMTMVAYVFIKYGPQLALHDQLRTAVLGFTAVAFFATGVAGLFGAFLNKFAPVRGGAQIILYESK